MNMLLKVQVFVWVVLFVGFQRYVEESACVLESVQVSI